MCAHLNWLEQNKGLMDRNAKILFIGHSLFFGNGGQENIVPAMLATRGWTVTEGHCYAPGQYFKGHWFNNLGETTPEQIEDAKRMQRWMGDRYQAEMLQNAIDACTGRLDRVAKEGPWDFVVAVSGKDSDYEYAPKILDRVMAESPNCQPVIFMIWPSQRTPELLPQNQYRGERLALENSALLAPAGIAMRQAAIERPDLMLYRSLKDDHQNKRSNYLIACVIFATISGESPVGLPATLDLPAATEDFANGTGGAFSVEPELAAYFQDLAWRVCTESNERMAGLTLDDLHEPVIVKKTKERDDDAPSGRILYVGNSYADCDGKLHRVLDAMLKDHDTCMDVFCDDAATLQSHLLNDNGELTPRQARIMDKVRDNFARAGEDYDKAALDGFADWSYESAVQHLMNRQGKLTAKLADDAPWKNVVVTPFRGALDPEGHDFPAAGLRIIERIYEADPVTSILVAQPCPWTDDPADWDAIIATTSLLATETKSYIVPVIEAWQEALAQRPGLQLRGERQSPSEMGLYLTACVLYVRLTGASCADLDLAGCDITPEQGAFLRGVALAVCDSRP